MAPYSLYRSLNISLFFIVSIVVQYLKFCGPVSVVYCFASSSFVSVVFVCAWDVIYDKLFVGINVDL